MPHLNAWIEDDAGLAWTAYWVSSATPERRPARQLCQTYEQARQRVEREARDLGVDIEWLDWRRNWE